MILPPAPYPQGAPATPLDESFTFQQFVVGDCNELACAAAKAISEFPGGPYNPFFIHGGSGLGKTHLLQAICHSVRSAHPGKQLLYLTCENFVNQFIQAVTNGELDQFRFKYREVDLLLIDDIQFLEGKTRTQDEFFHTFNTLFHSGKQIVLSSDRPPKEIPTLQERLISRFRWGMVTKVEPPRYETRVAIAQRKGRMMGHELPIEVAEILAESIDTNIRELEGAVTKVIGFATLMNRPIDLETVRESLRDLVRTRIQVTIHDIIALVSEEYEVPARDLQSKKRVRSIVRARQVGMYLSRQLTRLSLEEIGGYFGGRDHSTVLHSTRKVERIRLEEKDEDRRIDQLAEMLQRGRN